MIKKLCAIVFTLVFLTFLPLQAGERTIPVDMYLMIDTSLSMAEQGKFDSMQSWVQEQLLGQMLIPGDWISIYQFYGKTEHLLTVELAGDAERKNIANTFASLKPDGAFTDIGLALDTLKEALSRKEKNDRYKIMLMLTDLKQEAPWTSRYAGSPDEFENPFLAQARILEHDNWYEITLDMDIQKQVVRTSRQLFSVITESSERYDSSELGEALDSGTDTEIEKTGDELLPNETSTPDSHENESWISNISSKRSNALPFLIALVLLSAVLIVFVTRTIIIVRRRKAKDSDQDETKETS